MPYAFAYLIFCGAFLLAAFPILLLVQKVFGENRERDEGLMTAIVFMLVFGLLLAAG